MDYTETLNDPTLLAGFKELLNDPDSLVVKRTIRVFANVYNQSLRLLSEDNISEETYLKAWPYLIDVIDDIFNMFVTTENEGVLLILVKFLECSLDRNLTSDFSKYPDICRKSRDYIKRGLRALKDLVSTPYVGGSVFIVAVKAIIRIACLREDLYQPVTDLVKKLMDSLPPTLFDHNVRSLNKILQLNLFRLLKRSTSSELSKKLIQMMVSVGASRKFLIPWTPKEVVVPKRKLTQQNIDDVILGRVSPPKKPKMEVAKIIERIEQKNKILPNVINAEPPKSSFQFLTSLIPKITSKQNEEQQICNRLSLDKVCSIILSNLHCLPDSMPKTFPVDFVEKTVVSENVNIVHQHLATMLVDIFDDDQLKQISTGPVISAPISEIESEVTEVRIPSPIDMNDQPIFPTGDIDMRKRVLPSKQLGDIDMRVAPKANVIEKRIPSPVNVSLPVVNTVESVPEERINTVIRKDPRNENKLRKTPSPEVSPRNDTTIDPTESVALEKTNIKGPRIDPRLQNRAPISQTIPELLKENIRQDPRLGSTRSRDPRKKASNIIEKNNMSDIDNNIQVNNANMMPITFQNMLPPNHMPHNTGYPGSSSVNMDFQNQFNQNRDPRKFMPRFETNAAPVGMFTNYPARGPVNKFNNPYKYFRNGFQHNSGLS